MALHFFHMQITYIFLIKKETTLVKKKPKFMGSSKNSKQEKTYTNRNKQTDTNRIKHLPSPRDQTRKGDSI